MRTTVRVNPSLMAQVKRKAATQGKTLTKVFEECLRQWVRQGFVAKPVRRKIKILTFKGTGVHPGINLNDNSAIEDLLDDARLPS